MYAASERSMRTSAIGLSTASRIVEDFIRGLPKAELHVHIEGSLEPEMMYELARRNRVSIRFDSVEGVRRAYRFSDLQSFLDVYSEGARVLVNEQDFHDLTSAYLARAREHNVRHAEISFDPQLHTDRGIAFETVIRGIDRALVEAHQRWGISSGLILCFLRHLSQESAMATLERALPFKDRVVAVGLDSSEVGHPPEKFVHVFELARAQGFRAVAHAGEEGPAEYVRQALDLLGAERIDHGVRCMEDPALVSRLARARIPLTVCPLSNVSLKVFPSLSEHNLKDLLDAGLMVTLNSDDPAYFGGYVNDNYLAAWRSLNLAREEISRIARHGFEASFLDAASKLRLQAELRSYVATGS